MNDKMRCENCFFFEYEVDNFGSCHKNSPQPHYAPDEEQKWVWPQVYTHDWCGDFELDNTKYYRAITKGN